MVQTILGLCLLYLVSLSRPKLFTPCSSHALILPVVRPLPAMPYTNPIRARPANRKTSVVELVQSLV